MGKKKRPKKAFNKSKAKSTPRLRSRNLKKSDQRNKVEVCEPDRTTSFTHEVYDILSVLPQRDLIFPNKTLSKELISILDGLYLLNYESEARGVLSLDESYGRVKYLEWFNKSRFGRSSFESGNVQKLQVTQ